MLRTLLGIICIVAALLGMIYPPLKSIEVLIVGILLWAWDDIMGACKTITDNQRVLGEALDKLLGEEKK